MTYRSIVVSGAAGFIGMHVAEALCRDGRRVLGIDNLNPYYSSELKRDRLARLQGLPTFEFVHADVADSRALSAAVARFKPQAFVHLAAQPGVRYSLSHPESYVQANLVGFANVLEVCRHQDLKHLVYASSSSVYGMNRVMPLSTHDSADHPVSLYAATKRANEVMAHCYAHLYALPTTGLRFFTVYGPWGRPDMAPYKFTKSILANEAVELYNQGNMRRDFTYVDDATDALMRLVDRPPQGVASNPNDPSISPAPFRIYNVGNGRPESVLRFVQLLERALGHRATRRLMPMQPGEVAETFADIEDLRRDVGFEPKTTIEAGIPLFVQWYRDYHATSGNAPREESR